MSKIRTESFDLIVSEINKIYDSLSSLTNDEFRGRLKDLQYLLNTSDEGSNSLDACLPEVYAIVKETARRFSDGNIEVTANAYDKWLADRYDFVSIRGHKAIYHNKWQVGGVPFTWDMVHYDEQVSGGIHLHLGHAIEMATGEGKTLVATLPVFLNALTHRSVHLMTVNDYLSKRDYELTRPIYTFHGLTVDCLEIHDRHTESYKSAYLADIVLGSNSAFVFDYLYDHLALDKKDCVQTAHNYSIIDELDSILIDDADTPHIVSGGIPYSNEKVFKDHVDVIKELIESNTGELFNVNLLEKTASLTDEGKQWLCEKLHNESLYKYTKTYEVDNFNQLPQEEKDVILSNLHLQNVIKQLLLAYTIYIKDVDYVVEGNKVIILDQNTGRKKPSHRWEHGLHTAIELKENVPVQPDSDGMAVISLKNYFKLYKKVSGMSGTILEVADELSEIYGLQCAKIPTHKPLQRVDAPLQIYRTQGQKDAAILQTVIANHTAGRPTLIGSISIKRADEIEKQLTAVGLPFNRLDARNTRDEAATVANAGISNTITLSTSVAGRGTDIKPSADAIANGGLCVVGTDLFGSTRTDLQLKGRTGRQGNPGNSIFFSSLDDLILDYLTNEERNEMGKALENIEGGNLTCDSIHWFFKQAQTNRDNIFREKRKTTARKDDIIAPRRTKFYTQRNSVLFNADKVNEIISDISANSGKSLSEIDDALMKHYSKAVELIKRNRSNNSLATHAYIPFSDNRHPFAIILDIDLALSNDSYYRQEFKRQCILQIYDMYWKDFVTYMLQDLDHKEIENLDNKYSKMMKDISAVILSRLLNASITFEIREVPNQTKNGNVKKGKNIIKKEVPSGQSLCPCGSGKKFEDCHGKANPRIKRRLC